MKLTKAQRALLRDVKDGDYVARTISGSTIRPAKTLREHGLISIDVAHAPRWSIGIAEITDAGRAALEQGS